MPDVEYNMISCSLKVRVRIAELEINDAVNLWIDLCSQLGVAKWVTDNPDLSKGFQLEWARVQKMGRDA